MTDPLAPFGAATRAWFAASFPEPTPAQRGAWVGIAAGAHVLVSAPTGSGKTLAAFLASLDRLLHGPPAEAGGTRVLYLSPLKALAYDVDRNLRAPLVGIRRHAEAAGATLQPVDVAIRSGDTSARDRRTQARHPADILITTPESLFLLLTSRARETLGSIETVIVDEVHAVAGTKRGAHLALSLERLDALVEAAGRPAPQRIGLSATQRPLSEVARFLGGGTPGDDDAWTARPVEIVDAGGGTAVDVQVVVPVPDMAELGRVVDEAPSGPAAGALTTRTSIWPAVQARVLDLVESHRSTIVFCNSRRLAERLCNHLNELATERAALQAGAEPDEAQEVVVARAHHGSVAREQRVGIEEDLKAGRLPCVVATSSLELGIDMGAVDLVVQVESPGTVASGLQRVGRAGHQVGAPSVGTLFPKYRGDLVECAVVARGMREGAVETTRLPRSPLDVLAQQVVAMVAVDTWPVDDLHALVRRAASYAELTRSQLEGVLDLLAGRYPADEFAELRPRLVWDRVEDVLRGRPGAQRLAVTNAGTIPDRGLYGVFIAGEGPGRRVGELDEEMVYETRPGETFTLGSSTWRIEDITRDQVLVTPAPGEPGKLPFWHGDAPGRPVEVGRAVGAFLRDMQDRTSDDALAQLQTPAAPRPLLDELAATNLVAYLAEQREATGVLPHDRQIVVERFRDEIGDWRVCLLSPFGRRVHAPWAMAIRTRCRQRLGYDVQTIDADDGIVVRLPEAEEAPPLETFLPDAGDIDDLVLEEVADSAVFSARFREAAARALLLPRRRPGGRTPLWQQRQRSADLLAVARRYPSFPILLETYRECLADVFDLTALREVLAGIRSRRVRVHEVDTTQASPFASALLFDYVAGAIYEGDAPLAERRASALSLDRELLAELLGSDELRDLIDADALAALELELQRLTDDRRARDADEVHDLLRVLGDLTRDEVAARTTGSGAQVDAWLDELVAARRAYAPMVASQHRYVAAEDAARLRDALGVPVPPGLPDTFAEPVATPTVDLVARYARTHGPFRVEDVCGRLGLPRDAVLLALKTLEADRRVAAGAFRPTPAGPGTEYCHEEVLRRVRRRSLAALRQQVEPVDAVALARFLPAWHGVGSAVRGVDRVFEVVEQLQGLPLAASVWERDVLATRVRDYRHAWLDELLAAGEVVWVGRGPLGTGDGRIALYLRDQAPLLATEPGGPEDEDWWSPVHAQLLDHLRQAGASFWPALYQAAGGGAPDAVLATLWDLVWAGLVTNDTLAPLRALTGSGPAPRRRGSATRRQRRPRALQRSGPPAAAGRWSLVADLLDEEPVATERATALATQLLERHGVLTRSSIGVEDLTGGFSAVYPVLKAMEESGRVRRGYFVEGLGGAQFAAGGAVDRLRALRESAAAVSESDGWGGDWWASHGAEPQPALVLAATDPANAYGAALPWPDAAQGGPARAGRGGARRAAGGHVVLHDGRLLAYLERGGRSLLTYTDVEDDLVAVARALAGLLADGRAPRLQLGRIDGDERLDHPLVAHLRAEGFVDHPRGLVRR